MGKRLFLTYCAQCHGSDARGSKGFPNLTDADWQWGGEPETIQTTIAEERAHNVHVHQGIAEADFVAMRRERDAGDTMFLPCAPRL